MPGAILAYMATSPSYGVEVTVGVSVGVALRRAGGEETLDGLTAEADAAMYRERHDRKAA